MGGQGRLSYTAIGHGHACRRWHAYHRNVPSESVTLQQAAEELGVHYMTAYRYVRHGQLTATKRDGIWQVERTDLDAFRSGSTPAARRGAGRAVEAPWADRMYARLLVGDANGAWGVVEGAMAAGATPQKIYTEVVSPALVTIGERWAAGELDISVEHRATGIVQRLIGRLGPQFVRRGRSRGTVVVGAPRGETHSLVVSMVADLLRAAGWDVSDLGADTPAASFLAAVTEVDPVAVVVSVTNVDNLPAARELCAQLGPALSGQSLLVGGHAVDSAEVAASIGDVRWVPDVDSLVGELAVVAASSRTA